MNQKGRAVAGRVRGGSRLAHASSSVSDERWHRGSRADPRGSGFALGRGFASAGRRDGDERRRLARSAPAAADGAAIWPGHRSALRVQPRAAARAQYRAAARTRYRAAPGVGALLPGRLRSSPAAPIPVPGLRRRDADLFLAARRGSTAAGTRQRPSAAAARFRAASGDIEAFGRAAGRSGGGRRHEGRGAARGGEVQRDRNAMTARPREPLSTAAPRP